VAERKDLGYESGRSRRWLKRTQTARQYVEPKREVLMQPMATFNPDKLCIVHDKLNNTTIEWKPKWATDYRRYAQPYDSPDVVAWDGLLLDGWNREDGA